MKFLIVFVVPFSSVCVSYFFSGWFAAHVLRRVAVSRIYVLTGLWGTTCLTICVYFHRFLYLFYVSLSVANFSQIGLY